MDQSALLLPDIGSHAILAATRTGATADAGLDGKDVADLTNRVIGY